MKPSRILVLLTALTLAAPAVCWNESGHRQIAYIAYELLDNETRAKVIRLIKEHPRYREDFVQRQPKGYTRWSRQDRERWLFSQIAAWPDLVRDFPHPEQKKQYHRAKWHFINLPFFPNAELAAVHGRKTPGNTRMTTERIGENRNILQVLNYIQTHFKSGRSTLPKAVQLCWLFHLVGDIHQPMHTISMYTPGKFPNGDRGGNLIITGDINLHGKWDSAVGYRSNVGFLKQRASRFANTPTFSLMGKAATEDLNPRTWMDESRRLAERNAYGFSILGKQSIAERAVKFETSNDKELRVTLGSAYEKNMRTISEARIVQAGYRLAALLQSGKFF